jgi:plastocyanin
MRPPRSLRLLSLVGAPALALGAGRPVADPSTPAPRAPAATAGATASVEGRIEISRALSSRRPRFRIYAEPGVGAQPPAPEPGTLDERRNIVVYIERVPDGATPAQAERAVLRQHGERFAPHVLPVVRGATVEFPNDDALFHNVFSLSRARAFDLGRYPRGATRSATFDKAGVVQVFCHIHSDMSAVVLVLDNPFFAVPDAEGRYAIPRLPAGDYTVLAWHERITPIPHRLHLEPGQVARLDFTIPLPAADAARER